jgi:hypothetical protein
MDQCRNRQIGAEQNEIYLNCFHPYSCLLIVKFTFGASSLRRSMNNDDWLGMLTSLFVPTISKQVYKSIKNRRQQPRAWWSTIQCSLLELSFLSNGIFSLFIMHIIYTLCRTRKRSLLLLAKSRLRSLIVGRGLYSSPEHEMAPL